MLLQNVIAILRRPRFLPIFLGILTASFILYHSWDSAGKLLGVPGAIGNSQTVHKLSDASPDLHAGYMKDVPASGPGWSFYRPSVDLTWRDATYLPAYPLIATPEDVMEEFKHRFTELDAISIPIVDDTTSLIERARLTYTELLIMVLTAKAFGRAERSVKWMNNERSAQVYAYNDLLRTEGADWTYLAMTMTGSKRMEALTVLLADVFLNKVPGAVLESGVWRGGTTILARGLMRAYGETERLVYVCDSFNGLPAGDKVYHVGDMGWDRVPYLEVSTDQVQRNFEAVQLLDSSIVFVKGFFNETMPPLQSRVDSLSILRLDGDMYQSTVDVLYFMYEKLSIGGYLIVDDWFGFPARPACEDFLAVHGLTPVIIPIDTISVYWKKTVDVPIQIDRYYNKQFKPTPPAVSA